MPKRSLANPNARAQWRRLYGGHPSAIAQGRLSRKARELAHPQVDSIDVQPRVILPTLMWPHPSPSRTGELVDCTRTGDEGGTSFHRDLRADGTVVLQLNVLNQNFPALLL